MSEGFSPEIQKRLDSLPAVAREFVTGPEMTKAAQDIGAKHQLHIDQVGALEAEAFSAALGITDMEDLTQNLADILDVDEQKAGEIANDANERIFSPIREAMKTGSSAPAQEIKPAAAPRSSVIQEDPEKSAPQSFAAPSVMMPSSKPTSTTAPAAQSANIPSAMTPASTPAPAPLPPPPQAPNLVSADAVLSEKKVTPPAAPSTPATIPVPPAEPAAPTASTAPKADPAQPQNYKADPYREPVE